VPVVTFGSLSDPIAAMRPRFMIGEGHGSARTGGRRER
jgi:hypothetical protein